MDYDRQNPAFYALLVALIFMAVGPIVLMFSNSFKLDVDIIGGTSGLIFLPTIQNYETALCDVLWYEPKHLDFCALKFGGAFVNSLIIALVSTALTLIIGCMAAYALVRFRFMGRDTASLTTLMVRMVPPAVLLVPVFGLWNNEFCISKKFWLGELIRDTFGGRGDVCLAGTHSGIILIYVAMNLPFVIWILQSFIVQVPRSLEEAARVDGAGPFQVFFQIVLPLIKPGLAAAAIFTFRIAWNEYLLASALSDRDTKTVPILIVNNMSEFNVEWGVIMATGMLLAIPPIIFTLFASRQIITGMTAGAVKG
ncbi:carbohydrate ABC transporter permease [Rhodobacteraceae bacterium]|jgi:multiple sugar transport system permease protein|nr:carbohydrate ABC transporter permease [Paracoccaceae bacterium]MBT6298187.1 carbohydrate ABC transporter permease [Paracoccaceae bacterium]MDA7776808.1 carbohydrate ABC transporter permease [Paracoccaceae bacterium]MDE2632004.1 carbohydrate ABC transporter permease [Paracoccaceae bacterium]HBR62645.1 sugar ABC transporter permease [Paracoccaceae bacterium]|tara:strand:- start:953 stop:1882 length:930 start_codon:yes stop_codon:yes gene_type:complete